MLNRAVKCATSDGAQGVCGKEEPLLVTHCMEQNIRDGTSGTTTG